MLVAGYLLSGAKPLLGKLRLPCCLDLGGTAPWNGGVGQRIHPFPGSLHDLLDCIQRNNIADYRGKPAVGLLEF